MGERVLWAGAVGGCCGLGGWGEVDGVWWMGGEGGPLWVCWVPCCSRQLHAVPLQV